MFEATIVQAHLLQTYAGFYSGSQKAFHQAELSRGALVVACKRMHLLRPGLSAVQALRAQNADPDLDELSRREREDRARSMLGWCIYVGSSSTVLTSAPRRPAGLPSQFARTAFNRRDRLCPSRVGAEYERCAAGIRCSLAWTAQSWNDRSTSGRVEPKYIGIHPI